MGKSSKKPSNFTEKTPGNQSRLQVVKALYEKSVLLTDWWLIEVESNSKGKRLGVAGRSSRERLAIRNFKSNAIIKRHDAITLETEDGISITITNSINMFRTLQNGFPREVCNHFLSGFPYDWKEFSDKCISEKSKSSSFSDVNGVASSIDDLPVAHVRDILMLGSGDSARSLIEKYISCHIPRKQEDYGGKDYVNCAKEAKRKKREDDINDIQFVAGDFSDDATLRTKSASINPKNPITHKDDDTNESSRLAGKDYVNCANKVAKRKKREDDVNEIQLVAGDFSDDATPRTKSASIDQKNAITHKDDDTNENSRLASGAFSDVATSKSQGVSKVDGNNNDVSGVLCLTGTKKATARKDNDGNGKNRLVSDDLSNDETLKTQNASKFEEKRKDKGQTLCSRYTKKATTCNEDDPIKKSQFGNSDFSDDVSPRTKGARVDPKNATTHNDDDSIDNRLLASGDLSDNATLKSQHVSTVKENSNDVSGMTDVLYSADKKEATARKEDDTNGKSRLVSDDLSDDEGHALCARNTKKASTCKEEKTNKKSLSRSCDLSDDATPRTPKTNNIEGKSNDKGDALCSTDPIKEKTPKTTVTQSKNKNSSRRVTRSMSRSIILRKRR